MCTETALRLEQVPTQVREGVLVRDDLALLGATTLPSAGMRWVRWRALRGPGAGPTAPMLRGRVVPVALGKAGDPADRAADAAALGGALAYQPLGSA